MKSLWNHITPHLSALRDAFGNVATFNWFVLAVLSFCCGMGPQANVAEMVRTLNIDPRHYSSFVRMFASKAIDHQKLRELWFELVLVLATPFRISDRLLLAIDEKKMAKEGRKMPASRVHHQSSTNNSKPSYIMGHSIMAVGLIVCNAAGKVGLVPLLFSILGGIRFTPGDKRTCIDHSIKALKQLASTAQQPLTVVGDALYCVQSFVLPLLNEGIHTISRIKGNGVAYYPPDDKDYKGRGRRPKYGASVKLRLLFSDLSKFADSASPLPRESETQIKYLELDLLTKWFGQIAKFVLVSHPKRGNIVIFSTDLSLPWKEVYLSYYHRFQIEISFKSLVYDIGGFFYRFWCMHMKKTNIGDKDRYVHKAGKELIQSMKDKIRSYEMFLTASGIAYGLMQCLVLSKPKAVWASFSGWLRTIRPDCSPSIKTCSNALKDGLFEFMMSNDVSPDLREFYSAKYRKSEELLSKTG